MNAINQKYIKVADSTELIPVKDVYALMHEQSNKTVLRITFDAKTKSFDQLQALIGSGMDKTIVSYGEYIEQDPETGEDKTVRDILDEYEHFCLDYKCNFSNGEYFVELTKKSDIAIMIDNNTTATIDAYAALADIYESTL